MLEWLERIDEALFMYLNGLGHPYLDDFMWWTSNRYIWFPMYLLLVIKLYRDYPQKTFFKTLIALILVIVCTDQLTASLMKPFFGRLRPCHNPDINYMISIVGGCGGKYSFVSSHAANTFGLASFFFFLKRSYLSVFLLLWAAIVSYSRVYLGVHYPGDILIGALTGMTLGYLGVLAARHFTVD